jgi:peptidoglycan/xylan/chitin deacetylase (PgdA/CDA1 family)
VTTSNRTNRDRSLLRHTMLLTAAILLALPTVASAQDSPGSGAGPPEGQAHHPCSAGYLALTFDDGPDVHTPDVLDVLASHRAPGTFFVEGAKVDDRPGTVARADDEGHRIANHTYHHERLTELDDAEIRWTVTATDDAIRSAGVTPLPVLRPTYGDTDDRVRGAVEAVGYREVTWDLDSRDWESTSDEIEQRVLDGLHPGAVILFHDGSSNTPETVEALPTIIEEARERGYCFGLLDREGVTRPGGFRDVEGGPHVDAIARVRTAAITLGCDAIGDLYCPGEQVERAQMASFLARALDLANEQPPRFADVASTGAHADAIAAVDEAQVAEGYPDGTYRPEVAVSRGQMASFVARAYDLDAEGDAPFDDVPPEHPHADTIAAVASAGIAQGFDDGTFRPGDGITRAQMASFLVRAGATG